MQASSRSPSPPVSGKRAPLRRGPDTNGSPNSENALMEPPLEYNLSDLKPLSAKRRRTPQPNRSLDPRQEIIDQLPLAYQRMFNRVYLLQGVNKEVTCLVVHPLSLPAKHGSVQIWERSVRWFYNQEGNNHPTPCRSSLKLLVFIYQLGDFRLVRPGRLAPYPALAHRHGGRQDKGLGDTTALRDKVESPMTRVREQGLKRGLNPEKADGAMCITPTLPRRRTEEAGNGLCTPSPMMLPSKTACNHVPLLLHLTRTDSPTRTPATAEKVCGTNRTVVPDSSPNTQSRTIYCGAPTHIENPDYQVSDEVLATTVWI